MIEIKVIGKVTNFRKISFSEVNSHKTVPIFSLEVWHTIALLFRLLQYGFCLQITIDYSIICQAITAQYLRQKNFVFGVGAHLLNESMVSDILRRVICFI